MFRCKSCLFHSAYSFGIHFDFTLNVSHSFDTSLSSFFASFRLFNFFPFQIVVVVVVVVTHSSFFPLIHQQIRRIAAINKHLLVLGYVIICQTGISHTYQREFRKKISRFPRISFRISIICTDSRQIKRNGSNYGARDKQANVISQFSLQTICLIVYTVSHCFHTKFLIIIHTLRMKCTGIFAFPCSRDEKKYP